MFNMASPAHFSVLIDYEYINYQELFMSKICILVLTITALYSLKIV